MRWRTWWGAWLLVLPSLLAPALLAAQVAEETTRYEFFMKGGNLYRADRVTGVVEQVPLPGQVAVKGEEPKPSFARPPQPANKGPVIEAVCGQIIQQPPSPLDSLVPRVVLGADRERSQQDIISYRGQIGLIQALNVQSNRIKGIISVTNKGPRRLESLELTLTATSVKDGDVALEHRLLMGYRPGLKEPPAPPPDSTRPPAAVYLPVDLEAPPGGLSKFDIKVTYLKFAEE
jgi:hypothetical protein